MEETIKLPSLKRPRKQWKPQQLRDDDRPTCSLVGHTCGPKRNNSTFRSAIANIGPLFASPF
jgi:hypothetical protein